MAADLMSLDAAKRFSKLGSTSEHDEDLQAILSSVSEAIRSYTGFDWDTRAHIEKRNGHGQRALVALKAGGVGPPIKADPLPTVTENGIALTVATGYSASADVIVDLDEGVFYRRSGDGTWEPGILNLVLGYTTEYAVASIPGDIVMPAKYLVGMLWKHQDRKLIGVQARSSREGNTSLIDELPGPYKEMLDRRRRTLRPPR